MPFDTGVIGSQNHVKFVLKKGCELVRDTNSFVHISKTRTFSSVFGGFRDIITSVIKTEHIFGVSIQNNIDLHVFQKISDAFTFLPFSRENPERDHG